MKKYKIAITYGTFDLFHIGHLNLLTQIKNLADQLIVAVSTDEFNSLKGKNTIIPFLNRIKIVESIKVVNSTIKEETFEQKILDIKKYNVDLFAIGDDWAGKFEFLKPHCDVLYLPRTKGISSTKIKNILNNNNV